MVVLDVMLPGKDGFAVASELRAAGQYVPILMLTARGRPEDVLRGFEAGADDYLPKPFELAILLARVNGLLRRRRWNEQDTPARRPDAPTTPTPFAGRTLDFGAMEVRARGQVAPADADGVRAAALSREERRAGVSRGTHPRGRVGPAREHRHARHRQLHRAARRYLEDRPASPQFLLTVRGVGYKFQPDAA